MSKMDDAPPPYSEAAPPFNPNYRGNPGEPQHNFTPVVPPQVNQPQPQQQHTVYVVQNQQFGQSPVQMTCPGCHAQVVSEIQTESGTCAWLACCACCFIGCDAGCCLLPFCMDDFQDFVHKCPNCKQFLGAYRRM